MRCGAINTITAITRATCPAGSPGRYTVRRIWKRLRRVPAIRLIREAMGPELPVFQSVFAPIAVLLNLCGGRSPGRYRPAPREQCMLLDYFRNHKEATHRALTHIAHSLADYSVRCIHAGADGIFFAEMGLAREGYLTLAEWQEFTEPYDRIVLESIGDKPSILHTCGIYGNPERFVGYPIQGLHWAESAPGNPPIAGSERWEAWTSGCSARERRRRLPSWHGRRWTTTAAAPSCWCRSALWT